MPDTASKSIELADIISILFTNCQLKENLFVAQFGVSIVEFRCLRVLFRHPDITVNRLAQKMSLTSSRITRIVDGLVKKNLVNRISGQDDRRVYYVMLTSHGRELAEKMLHEYVIMHEDILRPISAEDKDIIFRCLKKLNSLVANWLDHQHN